MKTNHFIVIAISVLFYSCTKQDKLFRFEHEASIDSLSMYVIYTLNP
jgi:hypothetical protein